MNAKSSDKPEIVDCPPTVDAPPPDSVQEAELVTGPAPTFRPMVDVADDGQPKFPNAGERIDDFELLKILGEGAFGRVFLAKQVSLDRQVALKITQNKGSEARTLASLEHDNIVQVFSESVDGGKDLRMLCMQYVAGPTLQKVIVALRNRPPEQRTGEAILQIIDELSVHPATFHPTALRDRELLSNCDPIQAVCWFGARLAEALQYAHGQSVLHRDIKPANILINTYGKPFLADFNLSLQSSKVDDPTKSMFGGTLAYMSPEHLDAFNPLESTPPEAVDERSDMYSLGVVLFEMLTGRRPFEDKSVRAGSAEALRALAKERREKAPSPQQLNSGVPDVLERVLRRCLSGNPDDRFQQAGELAKALDGCRDYRRVERELPHEGPITRALIRRPLLVMMLLIVFPNLLATVVNIGYNNLAIVAKLGEEQAALFWGRLIPIYNSIAYPLCIWLLIRTGRAPFQTLFALNRFTPMTRRVAGEARRKILSWHWWVVAISCLGWFPGALIFPLMLHWFTGPVSGTVFGHFAISFVLSGMIALTYAFFAIEYGVMRVLYPRLWVDAKDFHETVSAELGPHRPPIGVFQVFAGAIPLVGATIVIWVGVGSGTGSGQDARTLATALNIIGMLGFFSAVVASKLWTQARNTLLGAESRSAGRGNVLPLEDSYGSR